MFSKETQEDSERIVGGADPQGVVGLLALAMSGI